MGAPAGNSNTNSYEEKSMRDENETEKSEMSEPASKMPTDDQVNGWLQLLQVLWGVIKMFQKHPATASAQHTGAIAKIEAGLNELGVETK